jgi:hypothetical protein
MFNVLPLALATTSETTVPDILPGVSLWNMELSNSDEEDGWTKPIFPTNLAVKN